MPELKLRARTPLIMLLWLELLLVGPSIEELRLVLLMFCRAQPKCMLTL